MLCVAKPFESLNPHTTLRPNDAAAVSDWTSEGSSPAGLKHQDNNAHFTSDAAQVHAFQQAFEEMWNRPSNHQVQ